MAVGDFLATVHYLSPNGSLVTRTGPTNISGGFVILDKSDSIISVPIHRVLLIEAKKIW